MTNQPLVTAIITTHGHDRPFLAEAIQSVVDQDYPSVEILVVDHGGSDLGHLERRFPEVTFVDGSRLPKGAGPPRNLAASMSRGELLAFLDHDDVWLPGKLTRQVRYFSEHPAAGSCFTQFEQLVASTGEIRPGFGRQASVFGVLGGRIDNYPSSLMVRRTVFDAAGGFPEDPRAAEDVDFTINICRVAPSGFVDEVLMRYRIHGGNFTRDWRRPYFAGDYTLRSHRRQAIMRGDRSTARVAARGRRAIRPNYGREAYEAFRQGVKGGRLGAAADLAWALRLDPKGTILALKRTFVRRAARRAPSDAE